MCNYREVYRAKAGRGKPDFSVQFDMEEVKPFSVQYAGNGKYFDNLSDALCYIVKRGWVKPDRINEVLHEIVEKLPKQ